MRYDYISDIILLIIVLGVFLAYRAIKKRPERRIGTPPICEESYNRGKQNEDATELKNSAFGFLIKVIKVVGIVLLFFFVFTILGSILISILV